MKQKYLFMIGMTAALSLTGCQSGSTNAETEALQEQITQLQQQITELEQQASADTADAPSAKQSEEGTAAAPETSEPDNTGEALPAADSEAENTPSSGASDASATTHTMEELTAMVSAYEETAGAAVPSGTAADDMEQFLTLKQEEKKIDNDLDLHEDELEYLYRNGSLSRDEYRTLERELERLEDRLDAAEDELEYIFGIDD